MTALPRELRELTGRRGRPLGWLAPATPPARQQDNPGPEAMAACFDAYARSAPGHPVRPLDLTPAVLSAAGATVAS